jgi:hypothetical protein
MRASRHIVPLTLVSLLVAVHLPVSAATPEAPAAAGTPVEAPSATAAQETALAQGQAADLQRLVDEGAVRVLRSTSNGDYETRLLVEKERVVFYVAMYYQGAIWRVFRNSTLNHAEPVYAKLAKQSAAWAVDDIQRKILASRKREQEDALQTDQARALALSREVAAMEADQERIAEQRKAVTAERHSAEKDNQSTAAEIDRLRAQIRQLESQLAGTSGTAPRAPRVARASQQPAAK